MKILTSEEFRAYMSKALEAREPPDNWYQATEIIHQWAEENPNFVLELVVRYLEIALTGANPNLSLWATGFQVGRDFELSRIEAGELSRISSLE